MAYTHVIQSVALCRSNALGSQYDGQTYPGRRERWRNVVGKETYSEQISNAFSPIPRYGGTVRLSGSARPRVTTGVGGRRGRSDDDKYEIFRSCSENFPYSFAGLPSRSFSSKSLSGNLISCAVWKEEKLSYEPGAGACGRTAPLNYSQ